MRMPPRAGSYYSGAQPVALITVFFFAVMASTDFRKGSYGFRRGSYGFRRGSYGFWYFGYVGGFTILCLTGFLLP